MTKQAQVSPIARDLAHSQSHCRLIHANQANSNYYHYYCICCDCICGLMKNFNLNSQVTKKAFQATKKGWVQMELNAMDSAQIETFTSLKSMQVSIV
jgi:hypothetical protein